eukprot:TRINITY_DN17843_c0_g1_i1.p1 TRINITY_DN17843_c0_g1~~TRINITY_DN17843_c0_g1_i1.p1  ORF type:complete len:572 (-),score=79.93 TRINITY_DN17843_c0_g1_i1:322-2037(-)
MGEACSVCNKGPSLRTAQIPPSRSKPRSLGNAARSGGSASISAANLQMPTGYDAAFLQRHAPNGETWADYLAPTPPLINAGSLQGAWADAIYAAVAFELTNDGWQDDPNFEQGAVQYILDYLVGCNYESCSEALVQAEDMYRQLLQDAAQEGSCAFLQHKARNGQTWQEYLQQAKPELGSQGFVRGAWGECITSAVIFEHENPGWDRLGPYAADGPAGQVISFLEIMGYGNMLEALAKTEAATHEAVSTGGKIPVFDATYYQPPVQVLQASEVGLDPPRVTGRKKAVLIGCNYPGTDAELNGCINDVQRWSSLLINVYDFQRQDMVQLIDAGHNDYKFFPTRSNILNAIRWLVDGAAPGDVLFFQFSGHGAQREAEYDNEADGMDELLVPTDYGEAGMIVDHELFDVLCVSLPSGCKLTVILDCCHSGSALDLPFVWNSNQQDWNIERDAWHIAGDVQMFSGCEDDQCSMDATTRQGLPGGAMTTAMCDVLEKYAEEPPGSYPSLLDAMTNVLDERGFEQRPRLSSSQAFQVAEKRFSVIDFIVPNLNPQLGQANPPRRRPKRNDPFDVLW